MAWNSLIPVSISTSSPSMVLEPSARPFPLLDPWVWRMAWRDSRRSRGRLLVFSTALTLGVGALVAIGSLGWNIDRAINEQARTLVGADLIVESRDSVPDPGAAAFVASLGGEQAHETRLSSMAEVPKTGASRLTQVRAIEGGYPFYGKIETEPPEAARDFREGRGALIEESLLLQFGLHKGDEIKIGGQAFPILGTLRKLPGEASAFASIAPRVLIPRAQLPVALTTRGSLVRYLTYLKLPDGMSAPNLVRSHREELRRFKLESETVDHRKRQLGQVFTNVNHFLSLVSFVSLLLGGIGVASAIQAHLKAKQRTVAVLRCLGASSGQTLAIYLVPEGDSSGRIELRRLLARGRRRHGRGLCHLRLVRAAAIAAGAPRAAAAGDPLGIRKRGVSTGRQA